MARDIGLAVLRGGGEVGAQTLLAPRFCPNGKAAATYASATVKAASVTREVRVVMVGDSGCGKTKLLNRFTRDIYTQVHFQAFLGAGGDCIKGGTTNC
jgi:hypothetical protein